MSAYHASDTTAENDMERIRDTSTPVANQRRLRDRAPAPLLIERNDSDDLWRVDDVGRKELPAAIWLSPRERQEALGDLKYVTLPLASSGVLGLGVQTRPYRPRSTSSTGSVDRDRLLPRFDFADQASSNDSPSSTLFDSTASRPTTPRSPRSPRSSPIRS